MKVFVIHTLKGGTGWVCDRDDGGGVTVIWSGIDPELPEDRTYATLEAVESLYGKGTLKPWSGSLPPHVKRKLRTDLQEDLKTIVQLACRVGLGDRLHELVDAFKTGEANARPAT